MLHSEAGGVEMLTIRCLEERRVMDVEIENMKLTIKLKITPRKTTKG